MPYDPSPAAPTPQHDRFEILDVLRGFALLGVLIANLVELGGEGLLATADQLAALPSAATDTRTDWLLDLLVFDKANTLFAVLFGAGFWIMLERLTARGVAFERVYRRRIALLTLIGFLHLFGWFAWDILHVYGMMGFVLLFSRRLPVGAMLWIGLLLLIFARPVTDWMITQNAALAARMALVYTDAAILDRQAAAVSGDFLGWVGAMNRMTWQDWFLSGTMIGWLAYALGRFYIGAWLVRQGWVQTAGQRLNAIKAMVIPLLVAGFGLQLTALSLQDGGAGSGRSFVPALPDLLQGLATPLIAAGYVCALALAFFAARTQWLVRPFAAVGQMALTNYLVQSPFILLILGGWGPGLGLAGQVGSTALTLFAFGFFAAQVIFSHIWMKAFAYGPAEWVWRSLTYKSRPPFRRSAIDPPRPELGRARNRD